MYSYNEQCESCMQINHIPRAYIYSTLICYLFEIYGSRLRAVYASKRQASASCLKAFNLNDVSLTTYNGLSSGNVLLLYSGPSFPTSLSDCGSTLHDLLIVTLQL